VELGDRSGTYALENLLDPLWFDGGNGVSRRSPFTRTRAGNRLSCDIRGANVDHVSEYCVEIDHVLSIDTFCVGLRIKVDESAIRAGLS